jgi:hypothetical protein
VGPRAPSSPRGFGIFLMRAMVDRVKFLEGGTRVVLTKRARMRTVLFLASAKLSALESGKHSPSSTRATGIALDSASLLLGRRSSNAKPGAGAPRSGEINVDNVCTLPADSTTTFVWSSAAYARPHSQHVSIRVLRFSQVFFPILSATHRLIT